MPEDLKKRIAELEKQNKQLQAENAKLTISNRILPLVWASGARTEAVDDLMLRAERDFEVLPNRQLQTKDFQTPSEWLISMKTVAAHCWPVTDDQEDKQPSMPASDNPWSAKHWNLTKQGQYIVQHGEAKAEQMAKAAGSFIGATAPAKAR